jgi:hypothetical protein
MIFNLELRKWIGYSLKKSGSDTISSRDVWFHSHIKNKSRFSFKGFDTVNLLTENNLRKKMEIDWEKQVKDNFHFLFWRIEASSWEERCNIITNSLMKINFESIKYLDVSICITCVPDLETLNGYCNLEQADQYIKENMKLILFHFKDRPDLFSFIFLRYKNDIDKEDIIHVLPFLIEKNYVILVNMVLVIFGIQIIEFSGLDVISKALFTSREEAISCLTFFFDKMQFLFGLIELGNLDKIKIFMSKTRLTIDRFRLVYSSCTYGHLHLIQFFVEEKSECLIDSHTSNYKMNCILKSVEASSFECVKYLSELYPTICNRKCLSFFYESLHRRSIMVVLYLYNRIPKDQETLDKVRKYMNERNIMFPILRSLI